MELIQRKVSQLRYAKYNPRQLTADQHNALKKSIQTFGFVDPIIVNTNKDRKNIVIGGHQRLRIARELNISTVPCVELDLTIEKEKELNVRLNRNTGEWDFQTLANNFDIEELLEWGFEMKDLGVFDKKLDLNLVDITKEEEPKFEIIVDCETEEEQTYTFLKMKENGYNCRIKNDKE